MSTRTWRGAPPGPSFELQAQADMLKRRPSKWSGLCPVAKTIAKGPAPYPRHHFPYPFSFVEFLPTGFVCFFFCQRMRNLRAKRAHGVRTNLQGSLRLTRQRRKEHSRPSPINTNQPRTRQNQRDLQRRPHSRKRSRSCPAIRCRDQCQVTKTGHAHHYNSRIPVGPFNLDSDSILICQFFSLTFLRDDWFVSKSTKFEVSVNFHHTPTTSFTRFVVKKPI